MHSILLDLPMPIKTPRLLLRPFMPGDGAMINQAILESFEELTHWMPWADHKPTLEESEVNARQMYAKWILRTELPIVILNHSQTILYGCSGFNEIDWKVPKVNIGYWISTSYTGQGIATEAANALTRYAFEVLKAARVEINADEKNMPSRQIAQKLGFEFEGIVKHNRFYPKTIPPGNTAVYARYDITNLSALDAIWNTK